MRVSDYLVESLELLGVDTAFLLAGGGMMHLLDALGRRKGIRKIFNHHEQASAIGAEGYARQSGRLGACFTTSGPGATNILTGLVECWQDSVPVIFVTGQSKLSQTIQGSKLWGLRQFGTFEVDILPMVRSVTKYAAFVDSPDSIRAHLDEACRAATTGRPGPVLLDIPVDIQGALIDASPKAPGRAALPRPPSPSPEEIRYVVERLASARRPLILAGHGIRCAREANRFRRLLRRINVPCVTTQLAADLLEYSDPLFVGRPGVKGDRPGNFAVQSADLIVSLGCSLHVMTTGYELPRFAPNAEKIQVDLDEWVLRREGVGVGRKIVAGVSEFLAALEGRVGHRRGRLASTEWHLRCRSWKREFSPTCEVRPRHANRPDYYDLIDALNQDAPSACTLVTDAGTAFYVVGQAFQPRGGQRVITSGAMGAMGHALPLSIGAVLGGAKKVICLTGDGSLQTNIQELATLAHERLDVCVIVVNNGGYVSIRNTQRSFFQGFLVGTDAKSGLSLPPLEKLAKAFGIPYRRILSRRNLRSGLRSAVSRRGPVIVEIISPHEQSVIPSVSSYKREDGSMESRPLEDMAPFLPPERLKQLLSFC